MFDDDGNATERRLNYLRDAGYSVQLSTCHDTGHVAKWGGDPGWTCAIKSLSARRNRTPKQGVRIRVHDISVHEVVIKAWTKLWELGGIDHD